MANGCRVTGLLTCDKNTFRPHDFPLASEDTDAAPVNHPALVKTSDQPSFSSVNFLSFTSTEALWASDTSPVLSLNLQPITCGGTAKNWRVQRTENLLGQLRKRKSNRPVNPKPIGLHRMLFMVVQKTRKRRICRDQTPSDTPSDSDTELAVLFADDSMEEEEQDTDCVFCTGHLSKYHNWEEWIRCEKYFRWMDTPCAGMQEILFVSLVRNKHCFVLSLYPLYL